MNIAVVNDIPKDIGEVESLAVDTEAMGLCIHGGCHSHNFLTYQSDEEEGGKDEKCAHTVSTEREEKRWCHGRDRLCLVQVALSDGRVFLIRITKKRPTHLLNLLEDARVEKIFHYARFDVALLEQHFDIQISHIYCTKIASKLARTYTEKHGLKTLVRELLSIDFSKYEQASDWGKEELTAEQKKYAASDVVYLHRIKNILNNMLRREGRYHLLQPCLNFLSHRVLLDRYGWEGDIFAHA